MCVFVGIFLFLCATCLDIKEKKRNVFMLNFALLVCSLLVLRPCIRMETFMADRIGLLGKSIGRTSSNSYLKPPILHCR